MKIVAPASVVVALFMGFFLYRNQVENDRLKLDNLLNNRQISILKDQCKDYEYKISSSKTYEDGYRDAMLRALNPDAGSFRDGYEAAKLVYGDGSYVTGYHNAVNQFGWIGYDKKENGDRKATLVTKENEK